MAKIKVAPTSLAGCFGCHMSFLDIDERLFTLLEHIEFDRSPLTDIKTVSPDCDIGIVEGEHHVHRRSVRRKQPQAKPQAKPNGHLPQSGNGAALLAVRPEALFAAERNRSHPFHPTDCR